MFSVDRRAAAAAAALIFAATASLGAATDENAETAGTAKADAAFDKTLGQLIGEPGGPPGAIAVVQRGHQPVKVFRKGVADQETGARILVPDRFRIGSVGKAFNGAVALQLVAQGKLSLSDTIGQRLPTLPAAWHNVTLGQLLNHTSGLPNFTKDPGWQRAAQEGEYLSPMDLIGLVSAQPLAFPPGSSYAYSNTDNIVVGLFAEMATGLSYDLLLYQLVFDRLHLRHTVMSLGFSMQGPFIHGYDNNATGERDDISEALNMSEVWAAGAQISSLFDLNRFIRSLRWRQAVWRRDAGRSDRLRARRGVRAERSRRELSGDGPLQVRHSVRDRLRAHGQLPRLHDHRRELTGRSAFICDARQHPARQGRGGASDLPVLAQDGRGRRLCGFGALGGFAARDAPQYW